MRINIKVNYISQDLKKKTIINLFLFLEFLSEQSTSIGKVQQTENTLNSAKSHIIEIMRQRSDLEKRLIKSNTALKEHMDRETVALNKIQEVLILADAAIAEKNEALEREQETKGIIAYKNNLINFWLIYNFTFA